MAGQYEIWMLTDDANELALVEEFTTLEYAKVLAGIGRFSFSLPYTALPFFIDRPDYCIQIWRTDASTKDKRLEFVGFSRKIEYDTDDAGNTSVTLSGPNITELLNRRIVAYRVDTSQAKKTAAVDDMMKEIVDENMLSASTTDYAGNSDTTRDLTSAGLTLQQDLTLGPIVSKTFAWRNVLMVLQELSQASKEAGTDTYFDIVPITATQWQFQTFVNQRGQDRRYGQSNEPVVLGLEFGNLGNPSLTLDFEKEVTHIYAGGEGDSSISATSREIVSTGDAARKNLSAWNRREAFLDAKMDSTTAEVTAAAQAGLQAGLPIKTFAGVVLDVATNRYGQHWGFGDKVTVRYLGQSLDALISSVNVKVEESGADEVTGRLRLI